jgi:RND superfamily putative drug exporter
VEQTLRRPARNVVRVHAGTAARIYAGIVCSPLRYLIILAWLVIAGFVLLHPAPSDRTAGQAGALPVPSDAPPIQVERRALRLFDFPVPSRALIVQRAPGGLSVAAQKRVVRRAILITERKYHDLPGLLAAVPILNSLKLVPGSRENGTTALTYLYFKPSLTPRDYDRLAETLEKNHIRRPSDHLVGATGFAPGWARQGDVIGDSLHLVEIATLLLIFGIVGITFRSFLAPLLTLLVSGSAYIVSERAVALLAQYQHASIPVELKPLLVVLVLAICTDYAIFYLSGFRQCLVAGSRPLDAARAATAEITPIILVAGLTIASCTGCLLLGKLEFLRILGPALSVAVLSALLVAMTFIPASMAALGGGVLWPHHVRRKDAEAAQPGRLRRWAMWRPLALATTIACVAGLLYCAGSIPRLSVGLGLLDGLPGSLQESRAYVAEQQGFAPGYLSPTLLLLEGHHLGAQRQQIERLEALIAHQPGVAGTLGPREQPTNRALELAFSRSGDAARIVVVFQHDPFGGPAVSDLSTLERHMPALLREAQVRGVRASFAGDTALVKYIIDAIRDSVLPISLAIAAIVFFLLAVLLRSFVAPVYLLAASALSVVAPLGLTTLVFQDWMHHESLAYYVPVGVGVLLFALGSDYNLFLVGRIWKEAEERPLREATIIAGKHATRTIGAAAITLAASFALLFIVPLTGFREFAFAMAVGVAIDAFVVRSYLVPALIALVGQLSMYPGRPRKPAPEPDISRTA